MATEKAAESTHDVAHIADDIPTEEEGYRVYVGNLNYKSTEEEVRELMNTAGGEILSVTLPLKFKRPAGYAFVTYKTEEEAKNAVEKLNESELGERKLALEVARSREEQAARRAANLERREKAKAAREEKKAAAGANGETDGEAKTKKKSSKRVSRRRQPGEEDDEEEAAEGAGEGAEKTKKNKPKKSTKARIDEAGVTEESGIEGVKKPKERKPRQPKLELTGEQSENTLFVANLPFSVDDDALAEVFTNLSIRVKSAKVIRTFRRGRGGRPFRASRGFGFVEVEDASQQKEAVEKGEGSLIGDRKISVKVANEMKPIELAEAQAADADNVEASS